jgi:hypothetical protein
MSRLDGFIFGHSSTGLYANDDTPAPSTDITSKGSFETEARQVNWRLISAGIQLLDVPEGVREGGGDSDGASSSSSGSNISMSEGGSSESGVNIVVGLANSADCSWASSSG